jgi:proline iminopeptidase
MSTHHDPHALPTSEGSLLFRGHRVWHRIVGHGEAQGQLPLIVLHTGPGTPSDYLAPLASQAQGRRVIFYDQLGCGLSDHPYDTDLWTIDLFVEELSVVRRTLGLNQVHLLGHGWGGMLALEHALRGAPGLASLTLVSTTPSVPAWLDEMGELIAGLPMSARLSLTQAIQEQSTSTPGFREAAALFDKRHGCRLNPIPTPLRKSRESAQRFREVKETLWGPHPFVPTGPLATWDVRARLDAINIPTLVMGGQYDETPPHITSSLHRAIPYSEYVLFENSAHHPHLEEPERFHAALADFLTRVEAYL